MYLYEDIPYKRAQDFTRKIIIENSKNVKKDLKDFEEHIWEGQFEAFTVGLMMGILSDYGLTFEDLRRIIKMENLNK